MRTGGTFSVSGVCVQGVHFVFPHCAYRAYILCYRTVRTRAYILCYLCVRTRAYILCYRSVRTRAYILYVSGSSSNVAIVRNSEVGATLYTILCLSIMIGSRF